MKCLVLLLLLIWSKVLADSGAKRGYDTIWGEAAGGGPAEITAVTSVFRNLVGELGFEGALNKFNAYRKKSPQYLKAAEGDFNPVEKVKYMFNKQVIDGYLAKPNLPYKAMENVKEYGDPPWAKDYNKYKDIGRQRFYWNEK